MPINQKQAEEQKENGILKRFFDAVAPQWLKVKEYGKALVGSLAYRFGIKSFFGGESSHYLYKRYRMIFQRMGFVRQAILAYKHRIVADPPAIMSHTKSIMLLLEDRFKAMQIWESHYGWITQDLLEFGDSFSEIIYSKDTFRVIGLKRLEPEFMYIKRDKFGRTVSYICVKHGIPTEIEAYRMMHIKMDDQPGSAFGVGLIEGGMDDLAALRILEDLNIQLVKHNIYPHRVYTAPNNDVVTLIENKLKEQERFGDLVVPEGTKAMQMTAGTGIDLRGYMLYYQQKFFIDVGVPMDMLIKGTGGNRSTATEMQSAFNGNAKAIRKTILFKLEWFGELVLASEGIVANIVLVPPEIDKAFEFAKRKEIREMYQEGLLSRAYTQELLKVNHPLNVIPTPEDFLARLNERKAVVEEFKVGLLARPYAIHLLGHDVEANQPGQPQTPNFSLPQPSKPGETEESPDFVPSEKAKVLPKGKEGKVVTKDNVKEKNEGVPKPKVEENAGGKQVRQLSENVARINRIGLQSIKSDNEKVYTILRNNNGEVFEEECAIVNLDFKNGKDKNGGFVMNKSDELKLVAKEGAAGKDKQNNEDVKSKKDSNVTPTPPSYFKPQVDHPKFADVFGDNEYSIRKPQRHVERIREEMVDAYGQVHKRLHERIREHHKPVQGDASNTKKTAERRWVRRGNSKVKAKTIKQSNESFDDSYRLVAIDVSLKGESEPWLNSLEEKVNTIVDNIKNGIFKRIKRSFIINVEGGLGNTIDVSKNSSLEAGIAEELINFNEEAREVIGSELGKLCHASLAFANNIFALPTDKEADAIDVDVMVNANLGLLEKKLILRLSEEISNIFLTNKFLTKEKLNQEILAKVDNVRTSCKNFIFAAGDSLFKECFKSVVQSPIVANDILVVDFVAKNHEKACKTCRAHDLSSSEVGVFEFESCHVCDTLYRFYVDDE